MARDRVQLIRDGDGGDQETQPAALLKARVVDRRDDRFVVGGVGHRGSVITRLSRIQNASVSRAAPCAALRPVQNAIAQVLPAASTRYPPYFWYALASTFPSGLSVAGRTR